MDATRWVSSARGSSMTSSPGGVTTWGVFRWQARPPSALYTAGATLPARSRGQRPRASSLRPHTRLHQSLARLVRPSVTLVAVLCSSLTGLSCGGDPGGEPVDGFPARLERLAPELEELQTYEPEYPLWTNGADKDRFILTPNGETAEPGDIPEGTLFFKQFSYDGEFVETRVIRITAEGPEYAVYLHPDGDEEGARLMEPEDSRDVSVEFEGESFTHVIPHPSQCASCHEAGMGPILGFTELQLEGFEEEEEESDEELEQEVIGYAQGNCVHCHNGSGVEGASFDMQPDVFVQNTVDVLTEGSASAAGFRVVSGEPDESVLYLALRRDPSAAPMPPIGVQRHDERAAARVRAWIESL